MTKAVVILECARGCNSQPGRSHRSVLAVHADSEGTIQIKHTSQCVQYASTFHTLNFPSQEQVHNGQVNRLGLVYPLSAHRSTLVVNLHPSALMVATVASIQHCVYTLCAYVTVPRTRVLLSAICIHTSTAKSVKREALTLHRHCPFAHCDLTACALNSPCTEQIPTQAIWHLPQGA